MRVFLVFAFCLGALGVNATVFIIDAEGNGDFTNMTDAITGSIADDTLYVVRNGVTYGNFSLSSPRTFIGNGYFGQASGFSPSSTLGNITLNSGASGTVFIGLQIGTVTFNIGDITFMSCSLTGSSTVGSTITNISILQSYISAPYSIQGVAEIQQSIFNYSSSGNVLSISGGTLTLDRNTFYDGNLSIAGATASNCIVNNSRVSQASGTIVDAISGNKVDTETNLSFEANSGADRQFRLLSGSTALNSSTTGEESGAFGFPTGQPEQAYRLSGLPQIPKVTQMEYNTTSTPGSGLMIKLKATTN